jgi:hypothetical protein
LKCFRDLGACGNAGVAGGKREAPAPARQRERLGRQVDARIVFREQSCGERVVDKDVGHLNLRRRPSTASSVIETVSVMPCPTSIFTCAVVAPLVIATTVPAMTLRAEILMALSAPVCGRRN